MLNNKLFCLGKKTSKRLSRELYTRTQKIMRRMVRTLLVRREQQSWKVERKGNLILEISISLFMTKFNRLHTHSSHQVSVPFLFYLSTIHE